MFPLQDTIPSRSVPLVTWTIIFINTIAFFYELLIPADELERFVSLVGFVPARLKHNTPTSTTSFRSGTRQMPVPRLIRVVTAPARASEISGSGICHR